jgi:acyl-CoA hydrolase
MKSVAVSKSRTKMTEVVLPNDTNPLGVLLGGKLLYWMDIAAAVCAQMHSSNIAVTVAIDHVEFKSAAKIGDIIEIIAHVTNAFNTSMEVYVEVSKRDAVLQTPVKINEAYFIFVCLDRDEKLVKVPPVIPQTKREKELFAAAIKRRKDRNRNK